MTTASWIETAAWVLSIVIACWLVFDMLRTGRVHEEDTLVRATTLDDQDRDGQP